MTKGHNDRADDLREFKLGDDISQIVAELNASKTVIHDKPIVVQGEWEGMQVDIAIQWNDSYQEAIYCFTNNIKNQDGGTHLMGFRAALTHTVTARAQADGFLNDLTAGLGGDDISEGLTAIVSLKHPDPKFSNQTNDELVSSEVNDIVERIVNEKLGRFLEDHPWEARQIVEKAVLAARARAAAQGTRDGPTPPHLVVDFMTRVLSNPFGGQGAVSMRHERKGASRRYRETDPIRRLLSGIAHLLRAALPAMVGFGRWWALGCSALLAAFTVGCCVSMQRAADINAALEAGNRARAEPSMRSAAERHDATLLPHRAQEVQLIALCRPDYEHSCVLEAADNRRAYRVRDDQGTVRLAVPIGPHARPTTRIARRGSKLLLLVPQVTPGKVSSRTACECDGMPRIISATGFVHLGFAFFVDEIPGVDVEEVLVPVTEDQIEWKCNARLL